MRLARDTPLARAIPREELLGKSFQVVNDYCVKVDLEPCVQDDFLERYIDYNYRFKPNAAILQKYTVYGIAKEAEALSNLLIQFRIIATTKVIAFIFNVLIPSGISMGDIYAAIELLQGRFLSFLVLGDQVGLIMIDAMVNNEFYYDFWYRDWVKFCTDLFGPNILSGNILYDVSPRAQQAFAHTVRTLIDTSTTYVTPRGKAFERPNLDLYEAAHRGPWATVPQYNEILQSLGHNSIILALKQRLGYD